MVERVTFQVRKGGTRTIEPKKNEATTKSNEQPPEKGEKKEVLKDAD